MSNQSKLLRPHLRRHAAPSIALPTGPLRARLQSPEQSPCRPAQIETNGERQPSYYLDAERLVVLRGRLPSRSAAYGLGNIHQIDFDVGNATQQLAVRSPIAPAITLGWHGQVRLPVSMDRNCPGSYELHATVPRTSQKCNALNEGDGVLRPRAAAQFAPKGRWAVATGGAKP